MPDYDSNAPLRLPILDRLLDDEPKIKTEAPMTRSTSLARLKTAVRRDLENLAQHAANPGLHSGGLRRNSSFRLLLRTSRHYLDARQLSLRTNQVAAIHRDCRQNIRGAAGWRQSFSGSRRRPVPRFTFCDRWHAAHRSASGARCLRRFHRVDQPRGFDFRR